VSVERWTAYWKDMFFKEVRRPGWKWQTRLFHTRMRSDSHYQEKLEYIRDNPLKRGLVSRVEDWPWRGEIHDITHHIQSFGDPQKFRENAAR
jgi:putative transposase